MRGKDDTDQQRPIFSRSADGSLRAGSAHITPSTYAPEGSEEPVRKQPPVLVIPPKPQPAVKPAPHHLTIQPGAAGPQATNVRSSSSSQRVGGASEGATEPIDVGDIWSEQERIRLQENWEQEQRKKERRQRRKELLRKKVTGIPASESPVATMAPLPETSLSHKRATSAPQAAHTAAKEVVLNINMPSMPKITLPRFRIPAVPRIARKRLLLFVGVIGVVAAGIGGYAVYRDHHKKAAPTAADTGIKVTHLNAAQAKGKPDYDTVLPAGKTIADFGGWVRVSPENKNPVYAYADQIKNVLVNVSEQPLPATFKADIDTAMDDLATQYSANDRQKVGSMNVYIGTSIKGPQSVLFVKGDLLILIKSASKIPDTDWVTYIRSLQ